VARIPILQVQALTDGAKKCYGKMLEQICDFQRLTSQRLSGRLLAIAFGIGGKDLAREYLEKRFATAKKDEKEDEFVQRT
jgi:hypothetical protein